jgi:hypothetical protein
MRPSDGEYYSRPSADAYSAPDPSPRPDPDEPGYLPYTAGMPAYPPAPDMPDDETYRPASNQPTPEPDAEVPDSLTTTLAPYEYRAFPEPGSPNGDARPPA